MIKNKICSKCHIEKSATEFNKLDPRYNDGLSYQCKACTKIYKKNYYQKHKEKLLPLYKKYREENREIRKQYFKLRRKKYIDKYKQIDKIYYEMNKEKIKIKQQIYSKTKRNYKKEAAKSKNNTQARLRVNLRNRIKIAIKMNCKMGSAIKDLGCSIEFLKQYLESKFKPGMSWSNWARDGWHIDHIIPLSSFDLTNREQFLKACHYTNLQPLWAIDNLKKNNKLNYDKKEVEDGKK